MLEYGFIVASLLPFRRIFSIVCPLVSFVAITFFIQSYILSHASPRSIFIALFFLLVFVMAVNLPKVLILGHSFVKRLSQDISRGFDDRADLNFGLEGSLSVQFYGVGGRTVDKLRAFDLGIINSLALKLLS